MDFSVSDKHFEQISFLILVSKDVLLITGERIIEPCAFTSSKIEEIYFPESLSEKQKLWCSDIDNLEKMIISPSNNNFMFKDDKYLLGKIDVNNDEFEIIVFVRHDIKKILMHQVHLRIAEISPKFTFQKILIYIQLNRIHLHFQISMKSIFHQKFQKYVNLHSQIAKISKKLKF